MLSKEALKYIIECLQDSSTSNWAPKTLFIFKELFDEYVSFREEMILNLPSSTCRVCFTRTVNTWYICEKCNMKIKK